MDGGAYITIGILVMVLLLIAYAALWPKIRQYRFMVKRVEPRKKRHSERRPAKKKKKSVRVKII